MQRGDDGLGFLLKYENVAWYEEGALRILDRRCYPMKVEYVTCHTCQEAARAISDMVTQSGGPYTVAAMGMALAAHQAINEKPAETLSRLKEAAWLLSHARPTTSAAMEAITNGAVKRAEQLLEEGVSGRDLEEEMRQYALDYMEEKYHRYGRTGEYLASLIPQGGTMMTVCFGETVIGTTLRTCQEQNKDIHMICAETRPYYQGARLTASVACDMGIDVTVITDNLAAWTMKEKQVDLFTSAADVITMDGHVVNKIGTFQMAIGADYLGIPYYVTGEPDLAHKDLSRVKIEEKDPELVLESLGQKLTMKGVKGYYPAFDITPPELCRGVVTDKGILSPYNLRDYFEK